MITLRLNEEAIEPPKNFWRRQFQKDATASQKKFDWIFGVVLPVVCFVFDPAVFKGGVMGAAYLGTYKPLAYILSFVSVMPMSAWLIWGAKLKWLNAFTAGLFLVGGIVSLGIGIVLLPLSLLGLIVLVGVLGFTPLFSSIVCFRNAFRAYQSAKPFLERQVLTNSFVLSGIFSLIVPSVINVEIKRALDEMINGDVQTIRANGQKLKFVAPIVNCDVLVKAHISGLNGLPGERMKEIAQVYKKITGEDIEMNHKF